MTSFPQDHDHDAKAVTGHPHENSWSANLEKLKHGDDVKLVRKHAIETVEQTAPGYHVNLVTHGNQGHPSEYLFPALETAFGGDYECEYIEQFGCGSHVTRVHIA